MKMIKLTLAAIVTALLMLAACSMSREEVVDAVIQCQDANAKPRLVVRVWDKAIVRVDCVPIEDQEAKKNN